MRPVAIRHEALDDRLGDTASRRANLAIEARITEGFLERNRPSNLADYDQLFARTESLLAAVKGVLRG